MRRLSQVVLAAFLTLSPAVASATIINPLPGDFGPDDGSQVFTHQDGALAIKLFDAFDGISPSVFGFIFANDPTNLIPIFDGSDQGGLQEAFVDFATGRVIDVDASVVKATFAGSGNIAFFYALPQFAQIVFTVPGLNTGGVDGAATFRKLNDPLTYLLGFETLTDTPFTLAYIQVSGVTPVPEPGTIALVTLGSLCAWRKRRH